MLKKAFFKKTEGQATVEYILLLVVIIVLALGIGGPLGKHLKKFSGALVGPTGYYACLMKKGRLPQDPAASSCPAPTGTLNITAGGPVGLGPGGSSGPGNDGDSNDGSGPGNDGDSNDGSGTDAFGGLDSEKGGAGRKGRKGQNRHKVSSNSSGDSSGDIGGLSGGEGSEGIAGRNAAFVSARGGSSKKKAKKRKRQRNERVEVRSDLQGDQFNSNKKGYKRIKVKKRGGMGEGYLGSQMMSEEEETKAPVFKVEEGTAASKSKSAQEKTKNKFANTPPKSEDSQEDQKLKGFKFGNFMKYLIIIIIVIVILTVLFSQIMEYQSRD